MLIAEWRTKPGSDSILIVDDSATVREAIPADPLSLSRLLTDMGDLSLWESDYDVDGVEQLPEAWGELVLARANSGEVISMDPELYWDGIYHWYRSRGVDYDS